MHRGGGERVKQNTEGFGSELFLQDTIGLDSRHCASVRTQKMYISKTELWHKLCSSGDNDVPMAMPPQGVFLTRRVQGAWSSPDAGVLKAPLS